MSIQGLVGLCGPEKAAGVILLLSLEFVSSGFRWVIVFGVVVV